VYKYKFELPLKVMNDFKFRNFEKTLNTRPYTGTCAIMDLLSYPIYEIDSIIYKHTEQTIRSFASVTKYSIHFHISKILADKVIHPEAVGVII
jgi:CTP-dependent riboflavin kinase